MLRAKSIHDEVPSISPIRTVALDIIAVKWPINDSKIEKPIHFFKFLYM